MHDLEGGYFRTTALQLLPLPPDLFPTLITQGHLHKSMKRNIFMNQSCVLESSGLMYYRDLSKQNGTCGVDLPLFKAKG